MAWALNQILDWFAGLLLDCLNGLITAITRALLITPDVTSLPQVQALTGRSVWVVDTVFVLAFVTAGVLTMVAGGDERARYTVKDLLPRCVVGFVTAHFSQLIAGTLIEVANAFTTALTAQDFNGDGALDAVKTHLVAARDQSAGLLFVVCLAIIVVLLAATACSVIVRFAVALVLTAVAPIALACHALPQTDPVARMWWRSYVAMLAIPVVQAFVLFAGQWMLLDTSTMLPLLGLPVEPGGVLNLFVVMVLLWTTVKVPGLMRRYATSGAGGRGGNALGAVVRVVVVQQLTRGLRVPGLGAVRR
ncbi:conjugal transfer protein TrbL family protein [Micromonospora aurantiaca]|uniref:conjugal transfer protein TrbL family protein n=1 Tax=Micromonospora aurantiaca (nom. illeg.) TaxID=47850 RepID=UPI0033CCB1EB